MQKLSFGRPALFAVVIGVLTVLLAGCGSGSTNSAAAGNDGSTVHMEALTATVIGNLQPPVSSGGSGAVVTGAAGATITNLTLSLPTPSGLNANTALASTKIAYSLAGQLMLINPDGTNEVTLTRDHASTATPIRPTWSANGSSMAFSRYDTTVNKLQIFTVYADGTGMARITDGSADCITPDWSRANGKIAFAKVINGFTQICVMDATGANFKQLSDGTTDDQCPSWSQDGTKIAFQRNDPVTGHQQIFIMNQDGGSPHNLSTAYTGNDLMQPAWSPDGSRIAFTMQNGSYTNICWLTTNTGAWDLVTNSTYNDSDPTWSPDGSRIAFARDLGDGSNSQIMWIDTALTGADPTAITGMEGYDATPSWSPLVTQRVLIGGTNALLLGTKAAGFLFGQKGTTVTSMVAFGSTTPSNARVTTSTGISSGLSNYIFNITTPDALTYLTYINDLMGKTVVVVSSSSANMNAAFVSFDASTGTVAAVLPYAASQSGAVKTPTASRDGNTIVLHGTFTGAWNSAGVNQAPNGAAQIVLDATGKIQSVK